MPLLMVFIDGLGLGSSDPETNPLIRAKMDFFREKLSGQPLIADTVREKYVNREFRCLPVDASMGVKGLPQSATGQTALLTGINGAEVCGKHIHGFPTKVLREIINEHSLFKVLKKCQKKAVFANTFTKEYFESVASGKWRHSVTTTAALAGDIKLKMVPDLLQGEAVYQDITNEMLRERGYDVPLVEPEEAALALVNVAVKNDYTLFEYFQTDRCGHKQDWDLAMTLLNRLDRFLGTIAQKLDQTNLDLLVISDHGNVEDLSVKTHTLQPVPLIAIGQRSSLFAKVTTLPQVYPAILQFVNDDTQI